MLTQATYSGARQKMEKKLSRGFITQYPLTSVTTITNFRLHEEFKHSPPPPALTSRTRCTVGEDAPTVHSQKCKSS